MTKQRTARAATTKPRPAARKSKLDDPEFRRKFFSTLLETCKIVKTCKTVGVDYTTLTDYLGHPDHEDFRLLYDANLKVLGTKLGLESIDIADNAKDDYFTNGRGDKIPNNAAVQRDRLRIEARLKVAAKLNRAEWGEKESSIQFNTQNNTVLCDEKTRKAIQDMHAKLVEKARSGVIDVKTLPSTPFASRTVADS